MRVHDICKKYHIGDWAEARWQHGKKTYGDDHLQRYNCVDIMEELIDAVNISQLLIERMEAAGVDMEKTSAFWAEYEAFANAMSDVMLQVARLDKLLPEELCTDEKGGERVWWSARKEDN